jgi:hypothetical protein
MAPSRAAARVTPSATMRMKSPDCHVALPTKVKARKGIPKYSKAVMFGKTGNMVPLWQNYPIVSSRGRMGLPMIVPV